jgi:glyoxylase-like metal-dependent hydrolase (beta-lactamase superfamily II)
MTNRARRIWSRRLLGLVVAGALLGWAQRRVPPVSSITTEEGQRVAFDEGTFQLRELTKRIPPEEPWPAGGVLRQALDRYGLHRDAPRREVPVEIAPGVYLVGQERQSNLTYMIDCGPDGVAVIDPTYDSEFELTLANVEKCGRKKEDIRWVLNTHCHIDHAMADRKFRELGAKILVHEADAGAVENGTQVTAFYLIKGLTAFPRCPVDQRLGDGEELELGSRKLGVIHTPGHTPGSVCFLLGVNGRNLLFSGDTVLYDGRLGWQGNPYADNRQYAASLRKLAEFRWNGATVRWDVLLPGHGAMALDKAYLDVEKARLSVEDSVARSKEVLATPYATPEYRKQMYGRPTSNPATPRE